MPSSVSPVHRPPDDGNGSTHDDDAGTSDGNVHGDSDGDNNEDRVSLDAGASNRMETDAAATATNESSLHHDGDIENADAGGEYLDNDDDDDEDPPSPPTAQRPSKEALLAEQFWQASAPPVAALPQQSRAASASNGSPAAIDDCSDNDTTGDSTAMQNSCNSGDSQNSMHRKPSASNKDNTSTNTSALTDEEIKAQLSALQRSPVNAVGTAGAAASTASVAMPQHFGSHLHLQSHSFDSSCHRSNGANRPLHHSDHGTNGNNGIGRNQAGNANYDGTNSNGNNNADDELLSPQDAVSALGAFHSDDRPLALRGGSNAGRRHAGQNGLGETVGVGRPIDSSSAHSAANANDGTRRRAGAGSDGATGDSLHSQKMQAYYHPSNATTAMNDNDNENSNNNNTSSSSRSVQQQQHSLWHMPSNHRSCASSHDAYSYHNHADVESPILIEATLVIDNETVPASMSKPPDGDESKSPESNDTSVDGSVSLVDRNASNASRAAMEIESGVNNLRQQSQPRTTTATAAATGTATTAAATTGSSSNNQHHATTAAAEASSRQASSSIRGSIIVVANTVDDNMKKRNRVILFVAVAIAVILAVSIETTNVIFEYLVTRTVPRIYWRTMKELKESANQYNMSADQQHQVKNIPQRLLQPMQIQPSASASLRRIPSKPNPRFVLPSNNTGKT
eukprot:CAMPEP_0119550172 /NCGR_PEP_ID=MMETSP1352-20130426/3732_1 /TAXON_ID=265584 /ORGANISM="Stauroneis constricta, Strain CCMP1120" /LENGTH=680 /DNA_ID=CAMNT_0007595929 /DNA_START=103 /DNA_END=2145 /DNA_ORIENTATION=+